MPLRNGTQLTTTITIIQPYMCVLLTLIKRNRVMTQEKHSHDSGFLRSMVKNNIITPGPCRKKRRISKTDFLPKPKIILSY